jgi:hypothetical protein
MPTLWETFWQYPLPELKRIGKIQRSNTHIDKLDFTHVTGGGGGLSGKRRRI